MQHTMKIGLALALGLALNEYLISPQIAARFPAFAPAAGPGLDDLLTVIVQLIMVWAVLKYWK